MVKPDPWEDLRDFQRAGEEYATPLPAERVRRLGTRRRHRRQAAGALLALAMVVGGGAAVSAGIFRTGQAPDPSQILTATPAPPQPTPTARTVTANNLFGVSDIPHIGPGGIEEYRSSTRGADQVTVCQQQGWRELGATAEVSRSFRGVRPGKTPDPANTYANVPTIYSVAAQFGDVESATKARKTYKTWVDGCPAYLKGRSFISLTTSVAWDKVKVASGAAEFAELTYQEPGHAGNYEALFESVGITQLQDRLMVTVSWVYGQDYSVSYVQDGDPVTDLPPHPQFGMCVAAAKRLAG